MNETNIKHGYSLMVRDARVLAQGRYLKSMGVNFKSRGRVYATRVQGCNFDLKSGAQYWSPQGLNFLTMLAPGAGPAK